MQIQNTTINDIKNYIEYNKPPQCSNFEIPLSGHLYYLDKICQIIPEQMHNDYIIITSCSLPTEKRYRYNIFLLDDFHFSIIFDLHDNDDEYEIVQCTSANHYNISHYESLGIIDYRLFETFLIKTFRHVAYESEYSNATSKDQCEKIIDILKSGDYNLAITLFQLLEADVNKSFRDSEEDLSLPF